MREAGNCGKRLLLWQPCCPRWDVEGSASFYNQVLVVIPSLDLIVRFGELMERGNFWGGIEQHLLNTLMDAVGQVAMACPRADTCADSFH